jgi:hypothetical protein
MSPLEFIAQMTQALGWPLSVIVIVALLRRPISRMLTDRPPSAIKAGPFELIWETLISKAETDVPGLPSSETAPESSVRAELEGEANAAPSIAVLAAYAGLERELQRMLAATDLTTNEIQQARSAVHLARLAYRKDMITAETLNAIATVAVLRNLVAHGAGSEITSQQASEYLALIDAVMYALRAGA